jgi:hypothetical protein
MCNLKKIDGQVGCDAGDILMKIQGDTISLLRKLIPYIHLLLPWLNCEDCSSLRCVSTTWGLERTLIQWVSGRAALSRDFRIWRVIKLAPEWADTFLAPVIRRNYIPILPCSKRFIGATDYIDGISAEDVTHSIMRGVDFYSRPYLCIRYKYPNKLSRAYMLVVFQRYTGVPQTWCRIGSSKQPILGGYEGVCLDIETQQTLLRNLCHILSGELLR